MAYDRALETAAKRLFGERIRAARTKKGITQEDLALTVRRTQAVISEWENGSRRVGVVDSWHLCEALGVSMSDLFGKPTKPEFKRFQALVAHERRQLARGKEADASDD